MTTRGSLSFFSFAICLAACLPLPARADLATIYLKNGQARTVELEAADRGQVQWRASASSGEVQSTLRSQIEYVNFPTTEIWRDAEDAFESGDLGEAITKYQLVIADKTSHYYPIPGNFVSLAQERLLRCYRIRMNAAAVAKQAQVVREEFLNLPPEFRKFDPAVTGWVALAKKDWAGVMEALKQVEQPGPEVFYLRGRALEETGKTQEAIQEYAGAYVLNFGGSVALTQAALQRSASLLAAIGDRDRNAELKAQVKLYRDLFGDGELWKGAPENLLQLADAEIKALGSAEGNMEKPESAPATAAGTVAEESGAVAVLPPADQRDYLLVSELEERVFIIRSDAPSGEPVLQGGVVEKDYGYEFDGTGGGLRIGSVDASKPVWVLRTVFNPATSDAVILDVNDRTRGGAGLYLREGILTFVWFPRGAKRELVSLGKVEEGTLQTVRVHVQGDGKVIAVVNGERTEHKVRGGGVKLAGKLVLSVGYAGTGRTEAGTALGGAFIPFKGTLQHASIATGSSIVEIEEREVELYSKLIQLIPPEPVKQPEEKPAAEESK
ncbi:MAG: hypothetical protein P1U87_14665 [Verrucomicrobiales bacterium]|nr:hypothetical protein [Verrucomicrobiales bacterium]